jgi:hypothetical protein
MLILPLSNPSKCQFFAKIQVFWAIFSVKYHKCHVDCTLTITTLNSIITYAGFNHIFSMFNGNSRLA